MKRNTLLTTAACILAFLSSGLIFAQDEAEPVMPAFETLTLVDAQTTASPYKGQFMLEIQQCLSALCTRCFDKFSRRCVFHLCRLLVDQRDISRGIVGLFHTLRCHARHKPDWRTRSGTGEKDHRPGSTP